MNNIQSFINNLQNKPYQTRVKILWGTVIASTLILIGLWILGLRSEFGNLDKQSVLGSNTQVSTISAQHYTQIDGAEIANNQLLIYFSVKNDTGDILNFSKPADVKLTVNGKDNNPSKITDRQNQPYVQKILSHTQNFGIAAFDISQFKSGLLTFDNLSFENNPQSTFKEQVNVDLSKLSQPKDIRN